MKKLTRKLVIAFTGITVLIPVSAAKLKDVPQSHWAYDSVQTVVDQGFMTGDPSGRFAGNRPLTRYEFAKAMSKMAEHYNAEIDQSKKDLESTISIMEVFQTELKTLGDKMKYADEQIKSQNEIINELNELVVVLGDEYTKIGYSSSETGINSEAKRNFENRLLYMESEMSKLKNKGLIIDTLFKGTVNDFRSLGKVTDKMVDSISKQRFRERLRKEQQAAPQQQLDQAVPPIPEPQASVKTRVELKPQSLDTVESDSNPYDTEVLEEVTE